MSFPIINLEARGLLPLDKLPFAREPMKITVADMAGQEFNAECIHDEIIIQVPRGHQVMVPTIGWKMRP